MKSFTELTSHEKALELLRWVCVPVVAGLGVAVLVYVARLVKTPMFIQPPGTPVILPSDFQRFILPRILDVLMAATFVIAGAKMAPRDRFVTAVVLAVLWMVYALLMDVLIHLGRGTPHYLDFVLAAVAVTGAAAYMSPSRAGSRLPPLQQLS